ncbi:MAG: DUF695 domain-containing protein [Hyphomicrobiaceae bacterium]
MSQTMSLTPSLDDTWTSAVAGGPGRSLRVRLKPLSSDWVHRATTRVDVSWRAPWRDRLVHGGPSLATDARMIALERAITTAVEASGTARLQIVETVDCVRTWSFYATDPAQLVDHIEMIVNRSDVPRLAVTMTEDPEWIADKNARADLVLPKTILVPRPQLVAPNREKSFTETTVRASR